MRVKNGIVIAMVALVATGNCAQPAMSKPIRTSVTTKTVVSADADTVRKQVKSLRDAVNTGNANAAAGLWTLDGHYIDDSGNRYAGRDVLEKMFADLFASNTRPNVDLLVETVRFPAPGIALIDGTVARVLGGAAQPANRFSLTMVKGASGWLISSGTETPIAVAPPAQPLANLAWLIGDWHAQRDSANVDMKAEWTADKNFILMKYEIAAPGKPKTIETQVVGWDPNLRKPISWHFNANGGFGGGVWNRRGENWAIEASGTERDGTSFTATNILSSLSKDGFTWQSVDRRWDGTLVENTAPLKVERVAR